MDADKPAGDYIVTITYTEPATDGVALPAVKELHVTVADGERATADFPHQVVPSGTLIAHMFVDLNENGQFDSDRPEPFVGSTTTCYRKIDSDDAPGCVTLLPVDRIPLPTGTYEVYIPYTDGDGPAQTPAQTVEVEEGETATLYFAPPTS